MCVLSSVITQVRRSFGQNTSQPQTCQLNILSNHPYQLFETHHQPAKAAETKTHAPFQVATTNVSDFFTPFSLKTKWTNHLPPQDLSTEHFVKLSNYQLTELLDLPVTTQPKQVPTTNLSNLSKFAAIIFGQTTSCPQTCPLRSSLPCTEFNHQI